MCGRYVVPDSATIERAWPIARTADARFDRRFNVAPESHVPVLRAGGGALALMRARWGFVPPWWKQPKPPVGCFVVRAEEAAAKQMWRDAYRHERCLIPADGWYEWSGVERVDPHRGQTRSSRQPHFVFHHDGAVCFAGVMSLWKLEGQLPLLTCAVLTRAATGSLAMLHRRMPVVLPEALYAAWLDPRLRQPDDIAAVIAHSMTEFSHYPVSSRLNDATHDDEELVRPVALPPSPSSEQGGRLSLR
jgi:putative SOS response-associated peptidase YedK